MGQQGSLGKQAGMMCGPSTLLLRYFPPPQFPPYSKLGKGEEDI